MKSQEYHPSIWQESVSPRKLPPLENKVEVDVCVIGAGIAGLSTAYLLAQEGKQVLVLDHAQAGAGETGRTTAHLACALDDRFVEVERIHGQEGAALAADSHRAAIDRIEAIVKKEKIDCAFERLDGYLFCPPEEATDILDQELTAAFRAGLTGVEKLPRDPIAHFDTGPCLRFPNQGQFHPLKYLAGLVKAIQDAGGAVHYDTRVVSVESGDAATVRTQEGTIVTARAVVVATNSPINNLFAIHTKQFPYRTYALAARVPKGSVTKALFWDTPDPYHYVRLEDANVLGKAAGEDRTGYDILIVGGEDHKTGQAKDAEQRWQRLEAWARERWPDMEEVVERWSGQVMETIDGLAFIGHNPWDALNIYVATGDSGMGMTHGTIAGMLITDLIQRRENPWAKIYAPNRRPIKTLGEFTSENLNVAWQYTDWITPGEISSAEELQNGSGAIMRRGLKKVAVYKDEAGEVHEYSASCPHLGCVVQWNPGEKIWDCPCHGSRFTCDGKVMNGPANRDLSPMEPPAGEETLPVGEPADARS